VVLFLDAQFYVLSGLRELAHGFKGAFVVLLWEHTVLSRLMTVSQL